MKQKLKLKKQNKGLAWSKANSNWKYFDDNNVEIVEDFENFLLKMSRVCQPYLLFYKRSAIRNGNFS